jgi:hypothetical protein
MILPCETRGLPGSFVGSKSYESNTHHGQIHEVNDMQAEMFIATNKMFAIANQPPLAYKGGTTLLVASGELGAKLLCSFGLYSLPRNLVHAVSF